MMYFAIGFLFIGSVAVTGYAFYHQGRRTFRTRLAALEAENRRLQQSCEEKSQSLSMLETERDFLEAKVLALQESLEGKDKLLDRARQGQVDLQSHKLWYHGEHGRLTQYRPADEFLLEG